MVTKILAAISVMLLMLAVACSSEDASTTAVQVAEPTSTPYATYTPEPTYTATPIPEPTPTVAPTFTPEPTATATAIPTPTATSTPTATPTPTGWEVYENSQSEEAFVQLRTVLTISNYTSVIAKYPDYAQAYNLRGLAHGERGSFEEAVADLTVAITLVPDGYRAYEYRANAYASLRDYGKALDDYTKILSLTPENANAYFFRGLVWTDLMSHSKALEDYTAAIDIEPKHFAAYYFRGMENRDLENYHAAIEDYSTALEGINSGICAGMVKEVSCPKLEDLYLGRGLCYSALGRKDVFHYWEKAISDYTAAIEIDPSNPYLYQVRSVAYWAIGDYEKKTRDEEKARSLE